MNDILVAIACASALASCGGRSGEVEYVYLDGGTKTVYVETPCDGGVDAPPGQDANPGVDASSDAPECVTDDDCAKFNSACLVFVCQSSGTCFPTERDEDGDGRSLCGGMAPGEYDCNDHDPAVHPAATEVCGDFVDQDCDDEVDEGCWSFCGLFPIPAGPYDFYRNMYQYCCAVNGTFPKATTPTAGMLIKGPKPTSGSSVESPVYYVGSNGKRYVFPLVTNLVSWYGDLDGDGVPKWDPKVCGKVSEVTASTLAAIMLGGNVTIRPGTFVTGIETDPKRYAVSKGQKLRKLYDLTPETSPLFVNEFWKRTVITPDAFFVNYTSAPAIVTAADYNVAMELAVTIEQDLGIAP